MNEVKAKLSYLRIAPKKVRQVARLLKNMDFLSAEAHLKSMPQKSVLPLRKLLLSAAANAEHNYNLVRSDLYVSKVLVDPGPILKRFMPRARGSAYPINKRTSHITLFLSSKSGKKIDLKAQTSKTSKVVEPKTELKPKKSPAKVKKDLGADKLKKSTSGAKQKIFSRKAI